MPSEKLSIPLTDLKNGVPVEGVDLHRKIDQQLKLNYVVCVGGKIYEVSDDELTNIEGCLNDYRGRMQIDGDDIIYTSPKGQQGVTSVLPF